MRSKNPLTLQSLMAKRLSRRRLLEAAGGAAAFGAMSACMVPNEPAAMPGFQAIRGSNSDSVVVPGTYAYNVVVRWGDAIFPGAESLDSERVSAGILLNSGAAERQARQFGDNCDGMGVFQRGADRLLLCVNHEFPSPALMFPGWAEAARARQLREYVSARPEAVRVMQAAVGLSVIEVERRGEWRLVKDSPYNRRITADTPVTFSGPASEHPYLNAGVPGKASGFGTLGNCAAGTTPWGTYLTAEENIQDFFGNGDAAAMNPDVSASHARFGYRRRNSAFWWETADARFDLGQYPYRPFQFGWIVELDPLDPERAPIKRTALGRFRHEGATSTVADDGRVVVYMGDDQAFEYFYKFVSRRALNVESPAANADLLDDGTLFVARLQEDGSGEWLPLVWSDSGPLSPDSGFRSQAEVMINCRAAADVLQATPLDRPEDVAIDPVSKRVYLACTENALRGIEARGTAQQRQIDTSINAANPRAENRHGHILEFAEVDGDAAALRFHWEPLVIAGQPSAENLRASVTLPMPSDAVYFGGIDDVSLLSPFANPDNLTFDDRGNLWIVTDGPQPTGVNNGCFVCPTTGPLRGAVKQFMSGPVGAEICGCEITPDQRTLFLTVQHPGSGGSANVAISRWPDGGSSAPRSSMVAIEPIQVGVKIGDV